jgi:hypothetical protein
MLLMSWHIARISQSQNKPRRRLAGLVLNRSPMAASTTSSARRLGSVGLRFGFLLCFFCHARIMAQLKTFSPDG